MRSRQFVLDHHWFIKVDLDHREIERRNNKTSIDVKHLSCTYKYEKLKNRLLLDENTNNLKTLGAT
jgi:hypothetical protein